MKLNSNNPIVFISYSWDSDEHKTWVLQLASKLISDGVEVILDQYELKLGHNLTYFIENAIAIANKIIVVFTPNYKLKADKRSGGVGYEYSIINATIYKNIAGQDKIIPILRHNNANESIPDFIQQFVYLNISSDNEFKVRYEELLRHIYDEPLIKKPAIGKKPSFNSQQPNLESEHINRDREKKANNLFENRTVVNQDKYLGNYSGELENGKRHGKGIFNWSDGTKYEGEWKNDRENGYGKRTFNKEYIHSGMYVGEWKDGRIDGKGIFYYDNGYYYEGEWKDGQLHGQGRIIFNNGDFEEGYWEKNGLVKGLAKRTNSKGDVYEGEWVDRSKNGFGTLSYVNGNKYTGMWKRDKFTGKGIFIWSSGERYEGNWTNSKMDNGTSILTLASGKKYEGEWKGGVIGSFAPKYVSFITVLRLKITLKKLIQRMQLD